MATSEKRLAGRASAIVGTRGAGRVAVIAGVAVTILIPAVIWRYRGEGRRLEYQTAAITRGAVTRTVTASGIVNPVTTVQVGTYVSGVIQQIDCDFNDTVRKGQRCAKIDPRPYQSIVDQDEANLASANAQLEKDRTNFQYAQLSYQRNLGLGQRGLVPQDTVDADRSTANQAQAQVDLDRTIITERQATLHAARINLGYTDIVSPVDGTVVSRNVTTGQTVAASFQTPTLFLIATDLTHMQVDANVGESDIGQVRVARQAMFSVEAYPNRTFVGTVTQVRQAPQSVQNVVTYDVVVSVANPDLVLKPGMTATIRIVADKHDGVLRVPDAAVRYEPGWAVSTPEPTDHQPAVPGEDVDERARRVWVLRDGRPEPVPVVAGLEGDSYLELVDGGALRPGDRVIVSEKGDTGQARATSPRRTGFRF